MQIARDATLRALPAIRAAFPEAAGLILFGSHARGTPRTTSDIDVLIVLGERRFPTRADYTRWDEQVQRAVDARVSPHLVAWPRSVAEVGGLWREVARDGIVLWEPDGALTRLLSDIRAHIERAGDRRQSIHGQPYWVRG
jgi:predicted nucleotidyltransferase